MIQMPFRSVMILAAGTTAAIFANMLILVMIGRVNRKLAEDEQISYLWWDVAKVIRGHRRFYPRSWLPYLLLGCTLLLVVCFAAFAFSPGLLR